jgi:hypothetical protein
VRASLAPQENHCHDDRENTWHRCSPANHYLKPSAKGNSSPPSRLARTSHVYGLFQAVPARESTLNPFGVSLI